MNAASGEIPSNQNMEHFNSDREHLKKRSVIYGSIATVLMAISLILFFDLYQLFGIDVLGGG